MAKKKKQQKTGVENYYKLKVKETDDLVAALKGDGATEEPITTNIAEITGEAEGNGSKKSKEFDPYKRDKLAFIPTWIKALFIKWWFAGAVCYFIVFGFGNSMTSLDNLALTGVVLGLIVDVLVNPIFRMMESDRKEYNAYMMFPFPFKAFWTIITNIVYYLAVVYLVGLIYGAIGTYLFPETNNFGVEPLLFATFTLIVDMAFIGIKDLIVYLVKRAKRNKQEDLTDV